MTAAELSIPQRVTIDRALRGKRVDVWGLVFQGMLLVWLLACVGIIVALLLEVLSDGTGVYADRGFVLSDWPSQLGTTLDLTVSFRAFRESEAPAWLRDSAHHFGFILPYTAAATERTGYVDEPWHARWVGADLATQFHTAGYHDWTDVDTDDVIALVRQEAMLDG